MDVLPPHRARRRMFGRYKQAPALFKGRLEWCLYCLLYVYGRSRVGANAAPSPLPPQYDGTLQPNLVMNVMLQKK